MLTEPRLPLLLQCPVGLHGPLSLLPDNPLSGQRRAQRLGHAARAQKPPKHQRLLPRLKNRDGDRGSVQEGGEVTKDPRWSNSWMPSENVGLHV